MFQRTICEPRFHTASGLLGVITILMCLLHYMQHVLVDEGKFELAIELGGLLGKYPICRRQIISGA